MNFELPCVHVAPKKGPPFLDTRARKAIKPYLVLDGGMDCEKTGGPNDAGRTKGTHQIRSHCSLVHQVGFQFANRFTPFLLVFLRTDQPSKRKTLEQT